MRFIVIAVFLCVNTLTAQTIKDNIAALVKGAPEPGATGLKKKLPSQLASSQLAYYGVYSLMKFRDSKRLGVFNIAQNKFQEMLPMKSTNYIVATGADIMLIYYPDFKVIELWNLTTFKKVKVKKISLEEGFISHISMGAAVKSRAIISGSKGNEALDRRFYGYLDLMTFKVTLFNDDRAIFRNSSYRDIIHLRPNKNMTKVLSWAGSHSPTGFISVTLGEKPTGRYIHSSFGSLNFANSETIVVTGSGLVTNSDGQVIKKHSGSMCFPVLGGDYYLQYLKKDRNVPANTFFVRDANSHSVISQFISPFAVQDFRYSSRELPDMTHDRIVMASKLSGRVLVIDNKALFAYTFSLGLGGKTGPGLPPFAHAGKTWEFPLGFPTGTKVKVEDGPEGMVFNNGSLKWTASKGKKMYEILISIIKPGEEEHYKEFKVWVK